MTGFGINDTLPHSPPVLSARPRPFLTSATATGCHPPRDSAAIGRKTIPSLLHSLPDFFILLSCACVSADPGVVEASSTSADWRGHTTVTSSAASLPPDQQGMKTSPGLWLSPGSSPLSSLVGPKAALAVVWKRASLSRAILSPPVPQQRA